MVEIKNYIKKYWVTILIIISFFVVYQLISKFGNNPFLFPPIQQVFSQWDTGMFLRNLATSLLLLFPTLFLATLIAFILGLIMGLNRTIRERISPIINGISVIPSVLLTPFALILAPRFELAAAFIIVYNVIWPTYYGVVNGIITIDKNYLDIAETLELRGAKRVTKVILPAAMPSIASGFISSLRGSFTVLVIAEMYGFSNGLGFYVQNNALLGLYDKVWMGFLFMVVVLVIVVWCFDKVRDYILRWTID